MRYAVLFFMTLALSSAGVAVQPDGPPAKLVFPSKQGDTPFDHRAHAQREKDDCAVCHDKLWPKSTAEPLKSSAACRTCHTAGGRAFEMQGNCKKCHPAK
jgi:c(7)-type cytochrome triheme protein